MRVAKSVKGGEDWTVYESAARPLARIRHVEAHKLFVAWASTYTKTGASEAIW